MKLLALAGLSLLFTNINSETQCHRWSGLIYFFRCQEIIFEPERPINITRLSGLGEIRNSTGSISAITLTPLSNAYDLRITGSTIYHIDDGALCSLPELRYLRLNNNKQFPVLTDALLENCRHELIETDGLVDLNAIKYIKGGVQKLRVYNETIPNLTNEYLQHLDSLNAIQIAKCVIKKIDPGVICSSPLLSTLIIRNNQIYPPLTSLTFKNCSHVNEFILQGNMDTRIEDNTFSGFQDLRVAKLHKLNIEHLTKEYMNGLNNAEDLEIVRCGITKINSNALDGFKNLKHLSLRQNQIIEINSAVLASIPHLERLDMSYNRLTSLDSFRHPTLKKLVLNSNYITVVDSEAVKLKLPSLEVLKLKYNDTIIQYENH